MFNAKSPKMVYSPDGKPPERRDWQTVVVRAALVISFVVAIGINAYAFWASNVVNVLRSSTGTVQGLVLDEYGQPIANAEIRFASAPDMVGTTNEAGQFELTNVPTGAQYLIVVHRGIGEGFVVSIKANGVTQIETLQYTARPAEWQDG